MTPEQAHDHYKDAEFKVYVEDDGNLGELLSTRPDNGHHYMEDDEDLVESVRYHLENHETLLVVSNKRDAAGLVTLTYIGLDGEPEFASLQWDDDEGAYTDPN